MLIIMAVFFYFRKQREDRRYEMLVDESGSGGVETGTGTGTVTGTVTGTGTGGGHSGGGHAVAYLYHERPLSQHSSQQHTAGFVGQETQPQMSEIRHSTVYYSEKAPIQIQTHDHITGYPFPQGEVKFFELSTNAAATTIAATNNTISSSSTTERSSENGKKEEEKTPVSLDQLPERLYSHPPPELHHKLSSLSLASNTTLPVSTPAHVYPEGDESEDGLKKGKAVAAVTQSRAKKDASSASVVGSKGPKAKSKVQPKRDVSVPKNIKTKKATTTTTKPKPFT